MTTEQPEVVDYIVVGSGAGGGPLAARLAENGRSVLVLEAGSDAENDNYRVPAFHANATEDPAYAQDTFVAHYSDTTQAQRDSKFVSGKGILYPRASTVGGCTAHHALITIYPDNADWDDIARATGDRSWRATAMRSYFERIERCRYRKRPRLLPRARWLARLLSVLPVVSDRYVNRGRHGFDGWLETNLANPKLVTRDWQLFKVLAGAATRTLSGWLGRSLTAWEGLESFVDPNDWRVQRRRLQGLWLIPLSTADARRSGSRERLTQVRERVPERLRVRTGAMVSKVLFDGTTATGVEYLDGPRTRQVRARREVILAAGSFQTPKLLKLSGIGPADELRAHGIEVVRDLPGVGANLQDRYEVGVVSQMNENFALLEDATFEAPQPGQQPDPAYEEWLRGGGVYTSNGAVVGITHKSDPALPAPDLFIFGLPADFRGYAPGYSTSLQRNRDRFTWAILKSHTRNTGGQVRLRSTDPREQPEVTFHYFEEGTDSSGRDLDAVVAGIEFVRRLNDAADKVILDEVWPGPDADLRTFVRDEAWGHHACGTCKIGPAADPAAVVDSAFRVHGITGLRVVDASVFPRIPGSFIVLPTYMISEKAADAILRGV
ncbi:GMC family oxidoreductase [Actinoplanes sp. N902-109]|uniref:GMC family oxidoreductase n=1 Tax=Actinoplanes sp. (strain N902-109) TaxID=649831 RepID=UPI00032939A6|nr:GMC oxidoreductase [Actinoplanes sp. N902-109]AGL19305.1 GMC oxidoreductase [Actinoplanes sp. N902-109]